MGYAQLYPQDPEALGKHRCGTMGSARIFSVIVNSATPSAKTRCLMQFLRVALDVPIPRLFDYIAPATDDVIERGMRVLVPFGSR